MVDLTEVERLIDNEAGEFRLIHRQTFGPEKQWGAGFSAAPCEPPLEFALGSTAQEAVDSAIEAWKRRKK